jgi:hypothetical protein
MKGLAAAAVTAVVAAVGMPAVVEVVLVAVIAAGVVCWVLASPQRSGLAAELLRAAHGERSGDEPDGRQPTVPAVQKLRGRRPGRR